MMQFKMLRYCILGCTWLSESQSFEHSWVFQSNKWLQTNGNHPRQCHHFGKRLYTGFVQSKCCKSGSLINICVQLGPHSLQQERPERYSSNRNEAFPSKQSFWIIKDRGYWFKKLHNQLRKMNILGFAPSNPAYFTSVMTRIIQNTCIWLHNVDYMNGMAAGDSQTMRLPSTPGVDLPMVLPGPHIQGPKSEWGSDMSMDEFEPWTAAAVVGIIGSPDANSEFQPLLTQKISLIRELLQDQDSQRWTLIDNRISCSRYVMCPDQMLEWNGMSWWLLKSSAANSSWWSRFMLDYKDCKNNHVLCSKGELYDYDEHIRKGALY